LTGLSVWRVGADGGCELGLPLVSVGKKFLLVVQKLLSGLGSVLGVGRLNDGVDGARLLAETAVNALGHVDIVLGGSAGSISSLLSLNGDGLGGANSLAELASNTSLFARGVSSESVLTTESGRDRALGWISYMVGMNA
jgi:hypothetical protein